MPQENVEKWIQCLEKEFPVVAFKASTQMVDKMVVRNFIFETDNHQVIGLGFNNDPLVTPVSIAPIPL